MKSKKRREIYVDDEVDESVDVHRVNRSGNVCNECIAGNGFQRKKDVLAWTDIQPVHAVYWDGYNVQHVENTTDCGNTVCSHAQSSSSYR